MRFGRVAQKAPYSDNSTGPESYSLSTGGVGVTGVGHFLPDTVVTNQEVADASGVDVEWIERKTGVQRRRRLGPEESIAGAAAIAARRAIADAVSGPTCS